MWWWILTKLTLVLILQYVHTSNLYVVHLKLIQCYMSIIAQFKTKKKCRLCFFLFNLLNYHPYFFSTVEKNDYYAWTPGNWSKISHIKLCDRGLPWWRSGWESACRCREHGFEPWSGRIPHAAKQLGPWATTTEPARLEPVLRNKRGRDSERPAHRNEEWPPLAATGESPHTETKTQHSQK